MKFASLCGEADIIRIKTMNVKLLLFKYHEAEIIYDVWRVYS